MCVKISIITVTRNSAATIDDTLRSVQHQTWPHCEHILIDGASTDHTLAIAQQYPHLSIVVSEPDHGLYHAMNKGVGFASGDIVAFLNGDDYYSNDRVLERIAYTFEAEGVDAVFGDVEYFDADAPERVVRRYNSGYFSPKRLRWGWMPAHPAFFCRRSIYSAVGEFAIDYRIAADFEWMIRAFVTGGITYRHLSNVLVRMRTGGVSTAGLRSTVILNREMLRACRENGIQTNVPMLLARYPWKIAERYIR